MPYNVGITARAAAGASGATPKTFFGMGGGGVTVTTVNSAAMAMTGNWIFVTAVVSGTNMQTYINGVASGSAGTFAGTRQNNDISTRTGGPYSSTGSQYLFNGVIDNVRIYNRALSATEGTFLYLKSEYTQITF